MASSLLTSPSSPEELCKKLGGGEPQSIKELLASDEFYPTINAMLRPIAVAIKLPTDLIEDVIQEVCLAALEYLHRNNKEPVR